MLLMPPITCRPLRPDARNPFPSLGQDADALNGGVTTSVREVGAPVGTLVEIRDLFFNVPARRIFLKSDRAESARVSKLVTQLALGYPEVGFSL